LRPSIYRAQIATAMFAEILGNSQYLTTLKPQSRNFTLNFSSENRSSSIRTWKQDLKSKVIHFYRRRIVSHSQQRSALILNHRSMKPVKRMSRLSSDLHCKLIISSHDRENALMGKAIMLENSTNMLLRYFSNALRMQQIYCRQDKWSMRPLTRDLDDDVGFWYICRQCCPSVKASWSFKQTLK